MIDQGAIEWFSCYPSCSATTGAAEHHRLRATEGILQLVGRHSQQRWQDRRLPVRHGSLQHQLDDDREPEPRPGLDLRERRRLHQQYTIGAYGWLSPKDPLQQGYEGLDYTQYFLQIAGEHPTKKNWASTWKGFNDVVANWAPPGGRHIQQLCGKTWIDSWGAVRGYTGRLDAVQVVTWHDYEEGTEIQSGIDNCLSIIGERQWKHPELERAQRDRRSITTWFTSRPTVENLMSLGDSLSARTRSILSSVRLRSGKLLHVCASGGQAEHQELYVGCGDVPRRHRAGSRR